MLSTDAALYKTIYDYTRLSYSVVATHINGGCAAIPIPLAKCTLIENCIKLFAIGIWAAKKGSFPWEKAVRAPINTRLVRVGLVISVDREHGTWMDHIAYAPATHSVTQVG